MRASSLSSSKVIDLINGYFVPVHLRNQDFDEGSVGSPQEKAERNRIYRDALKAKLPAGTVCVYLITPEGEPVATAPLNQRVATDPEKLAELMQQVIERYQLAKGDPVVPPAPLEPPSGGADSITLHLTARYLEQRDGELRRLDNQSVLGTKRGGNWGDLPSQDWIVLDRSEWTQLLPSESAVGSGLKSGDTWKIDRDVAAKIANHFFPPTENTDLAKNRIDELEFVGRVESIDGSKVRGRLEGRLSMKHPFYHVDDSNAVSATMIGYLDFERVGASPDAARVHSFLMVTDEAVYGDTSRRLPFGVAVRLVR